VDAGAGTGVPVLAIPVRGMSCDFLVLVKLRIHTLEDRRLLKSAISVVVLSREVWNA
jgi:hypothetical protein